MTAETVPCWYDIRRDCPETCRLHSKSSQWFKEFVDKRNKNFGTSYSPEAVLEHVRKTAVTNRYLYLSGIELVFDGEPETHKCEQRSNILASKSP